MNIKTDRSNIQRQIVSRIGDMKLNLSKPKTAFGRMAQNRQIRKFERAKMNTLKEISRREQGIAAKAADAAKDVSTALIASDTAKELQNPNSYRNSLAAWTSNINGNPNKTVGNDGETQEGSTSELGG